MSENLLVRFLCKWLRLQFFLHVSCRIHNGSCKNVHILTSPCPPVRLFACSNSRIPERIFMTFDIFKFCQTLLTNSSFGLNRKKLSVLYMKKYVSVTFFECRLNSVIVYQGEKCFEQKLSICRSA
jgi:hypothetical protein